MRSKFSAWHIQSDGFRILKVGVHDSFIMLIMFASLTHDIFWIDLAVQ